MRIHKQVLLDAEPARVFAALTTPDEIIRFFPLTQVEIEPAVGGAIVLRGQAGEAAFTDHGHIVVFDAPRRFAYRYWSDNHGTARSAANEVTLSYTLTPTADGRCTLLVEQSNLPPGPYAAVMPAVWDELLQRLATYLAAPTPAPEPAER